jgi:hypothetical protein
MARLETLARFEISGEILTEDTVAKLAMPDCKLEGAQLDAEEFALAWALLSEEWQALRTEIADYDTEKLRQKWIRPLLQLLGHEPQYLRAHTVYADNREIPLTYRSGALPMWWLDYAVPPDDKITVGKRKISPHELFQEYLDLGTDNWGLICNGRSLRLLHDYHKTLTRNFVEADLESIFDALDVDAFRAVWRIFHSSRFVPGAKGVAPIEKLRDQSRQEGAEIGKELRKQVLEAIRTLGNGFLAADHSGALLAALRADAAMTMQFYEALLRIVYRLLFLLYIDNKPGWTPAADPVWASSYSISRLREQAEEATDALRADGEDHWEGLKVVFSIIRDGCAEFDIHPYGGELFDDAALTLTPMPKSLGSMRSVTSMRSVSADEDAPISLTSFTLRNSDLLRAIRLLTIFENRKTKQVFRVNFRTIRIDALGSVYEALLDVAPVVMPDGTFTFAEGTERKLTGSYYTPPELVAELIKSALVPVIEQKIAEVCKVYGVKDVEEGNRRLGNGRNIQRPVGVEAGDDSGEGVLSADKEVPERGTVWNDQPDSQGSVLDSGEYSGRERTGNAEGFHGVPSDSSGESARTGNTPAVEYRRGIDEPRVSGTAAKADKLDQLSAAEADRLAARASNVNEVFEVDEAGKVFEGTTSPTSQTSPSSQTSQTSKSFKTSLESALLSIKVVDPACGSGAFLVQALDKLSEQLCLIRKEGEEPSELDIREARRDVVTHCIHGVDMNPMAVELCKFTLWLHVAHPKLPLSYLEPLIKCGNALIGVPLKKQVEAAKAKIEAEKERLIKLGDRKAAAKLQYVGWPDNVPDEAFDPVTGDEKAVAKRIKERNKKEREQAAQMSLDDEWLRIGRLADWFQSINQMPEVTIDDVRKKSAAYGSFVKGQAYEPAKAAADTWCAAFFWPLDEENEIAPTTKRYREVERNPHHGDFNMMHTVRRLAQKQRFFHWEIEFPVAFVQDGFDCIVGNPPWERIKLEEQEFFASRAPDIATATNKTMRSALISNLASTNRNLLAEFESAKHAAEAESKFVRRSGRFPLTAIGDVNTFALFSELYYLSITNNGRAGVIVPTGLATSDTTKLFFEELINSDSLGSLYDFLEARDFFPGLESRDPFCLLTMQGRAASKDGDADFVFKMTVLDELKNPLRHIALNRLDFYTLTPNTRTCPTFRTRTDADITRQIYRYVPVMIDERANINPWQCSFLSMLHMTSCSSLFLPEASESRVRIFEAKMMHQFDHRWATYDEDTVQVCSPAEKHNPAFTPEPRSWVEKSELQSRIRGWSNEWIFGFRTITRANDERTVIFTVLPLVGCAAGPHCNLMVGTVTHHVCCLLANLDSIVFDYIARHKLGNAALNYFVLKQLPILPKCAYDEHSSSYIIRRVLELVYTAVDLQSFAADMGYLGPPFNWDDERRASLRAELDAYYARLYGLTRKQLRYILDPHGLSDRELEDILDPWEDPTCSGPHLLPENPTQDFPGETFRVLKQNEERPIEKGGFGEYRTRRLVLDAWARLEAELGPVKPVNYREMLEFQAAAPDEQPDHAGASERIGVREPEDLVLVAPDHTPQQKLSF